MNGQILYESLHENEKMALKVMFKIPCYCLTYYSRKKNSSKAFYHYLKLIILFLLFQILS